jgi:hypothetical protein
MSICVCLDFVQAHNLVFSHNCLTHFLLSIWPGFCASSRIMPNDNKLRRQPSFFVPFFQWRRRKSGIWILSPGMMALGGMTACKNRKDGYSSRAFARKVIEYHQCLLASNYEKSVN